jgi:Holliday junction resolvase-like predicted endonuclease
MGGSLSRNKGKRAELQVVHALEAMGYKAHRSQQYCGANADSDVVCDDLPNVFIEVKNVERLCVEKAMSKAEEDAAAKLQLPVVIHRRNGTEWLLTVRLENLHRLVEAVNAARNNWT